MACSLRPKPPRSTFIHCRRCQRLCRRGVIEDGSQLAVIDAGFAEREPALAALACAAVSGLAPAGPERRNRDQHHPIALFGEPGVEIRAALSVTELGFSLHAATTVGACDRPGRLALCKYVLRPPIAQERVRLVDGGLVRLELRRPFKDGTIAVDLDPLSLLCRLAASVPPPKMHTARFAGILSAAHRFRSLVVPAPPEDDTIEHGHAAVSERPATHRCRYWSWARLMKRMLAIDADRCERCGSRMKLRALVTLPASIERFLRYLGEPVEPLPLSPARGPPFFRSRAVRRKLGELGLLPQQTQMFRRVSPPPQRQPCARRVPGADRTIAGGAPPTRDGPAPAHQLRTDRRNSPALPRYLQPRRSRRFTQAFGTPIVSVTRPTRSWLSRWPTAPGYSGRIRSRQTTSSPSRSPTETGTPTSAQTRSCSRSTAESS